LTRNEAIGDAGVAALSAAIRTVTSSSSKEKQPRGDGGSSSVVVVFDVLNLSACGIGDTGAEALAIALENHPFCVRHLDLSNNQISDEGAAALGRALAASDNLGRLETLDLSHNKDIGDAGAKAIAGALEKGTVNRIILRSCHIHADGAAAFAKALRAIGRNNNNSISNTEERPQSLSLDLSGNPLGILRKKSKSGGGKYSATALRSKATATTTAYMNLIGKTVQRGLKDLGISESSGTLESDDDEESKMDGEEEEEDPSMIKCGALALAGAFLGDDDEEDENTQGPVENAAEVCKVDFGLRHCSFDTRAAEALAAVLQEAKSSMSMDLSMDVRMNQVLEDEWVAALRGDPDYESNLNEMAERYLEAAEAIKIARGRSIHAAKVAAARMRAEDELKGAWGAPVEMGEEDDEWDSDADYDSEEDMEDYV
jgi:hypothetical protein